MAAIEERALYPGIELSSRRTALRRPGRSVVRNPAILMQRGQYGWVLAHIGLHLMGSFACCIDGLAVYRALAT